MSGELEGQVALITGASRGIGRAIAQRFAAAGATVAITARSLDRPTGSIEGTLAETVELIQAGGGRAVPLQSDLTDAEQRRRLVETVETELGGFDILVNNAGQAEFALFEQISAELYALTLNYLTVPFDLCQRAIPILRKRGRGWILNLGSVTAVTPRGPPYHRIHTSQGMTLYGAVKAALHRLTQGIAAEHHADRIAVNAIAPVAAIMTPGVEATDTIPAGSPMLEPVEILAEGALGLCCGDPSTLTGRVTYSKPIVEELGREVRTLDGGARFDLVAEGPPPETKADCDAQ